MTPLRRAAAAAATAVLSAAGVLLGVPPVSARTATAVPLGHHGPWLTDASGRVVVLHGLNQVYKVTPYLPSADGFGEDDAAFLAANGFNAMRVGVIWAAVEPNPGQYDDAYLAGIARTVSTLADHGIVSVLDFHQDLFNEKFQGEGAPGWAVQDAGLPNPPLGFPGNYFGNAAENHSWDQFWSDAAGPGGVGLQDRYAAAWRHVAAYFANNAHVAGYEILNEPWPGSTYATCLDPVLGCPLFDATLRAFYARVAPAIRSVDRTHLIWFEPNVLFNQGMPTHVGTPADANIVFAFHVYCGLESVTGQNLACAQQDPLTFGHASTYSTMEQVPAVMTEFGATNDLPNLAETLSLADQHRLGWLEWAYTGGDITSSSSDGQALVLDPSKAPTGANVNAAKLALLAQPYPQAVAGTPSSWSFTQGVFTMTWSTARTTGGAFPAGSETDISTPTIGFPAGYRVTVSGAHVASAPNASVLRILSDAHANTITVTVRP